jgi:hypothetical protein
LKLLNRALLIVKKIIIFSNPKNPQGNAVKKRPHAYNLMEFFGLLWNKNTIPKIENFLALSLLL